MAELHPEHPQAEQEPRQLVTHLLLAFGVGCYASALGTRLLDPMMTLIGTDFMAEPRQTALLASAFALPYALIQPVLGPIGDALGKRRVVGWSLLGLAVAALLCALAPSFWWLFAARILTGLTAGGTMPLTLAVFGDSVPLVRRQVAISRLLMFAIAGQVSGGALAGVLAPVLGWRGVLALSALTALAGWFAARGGPKEPRLPLNFGQSFRRTGTILANPAARLLFGAVFIEGCLIFGLFPYLGPLLVERGLGGATQAGLSIAGFGLGGFFYTLLAGIILRAIGQAGLIRLGAICVATGLLSVGLASVLFMVPTGTILMGFGFFAVHGSIQTRVTEVAPHARGSAVSMHAFWFFLGQSIGPLAFGLLAAPAGVLPAVMLCGAGMLGLGFYLARR